MLVDKIHAEEQTGVKRGNIEIPLNKNSWKTILKSIRKSCKETNLG